MNIPEELLYTKNHEWVQIDNDIATVGITDFAQSELGDIIFIELPDENTSFNSGDSVGTIEAVKTVADIYIPLNGKIAEVNRKLEDTPESINKDPYITGWIIKVSDFTKDNSELLSASEYIKLIK